MNTSAKLAIAAAAVVVVAVVGINLLPASGGRGGDPTVSPSPSPTPQPSPSAMPVPDFPPAGGRSVGRHTIIREGVSFTFNVTTPGWASEGTFGIGKGIVGPDGADFIFWTDTPDGVYTDPCAHTQGPRVDESAADLAAAVATVPGTDVVSGPSDVIVGGRPAKLVVLTVPKDVECGSGEEGFYLWYADGVGGRWATALGSTIRVWIIDVDGALIWIDGETYEGASPELEQELEQIVDSIQFE